MKKITAILILFSVMALALVSCGTQQPAVSDTSTLTDAATDAQTDAQTDAKTDAKTDAQTDKQTDKQTGDEPMKDTDAKITAMKSIKSINDITPTSGEKVKIAFIGDSITQGTGADNQATQSYPAQLQGLLDSKKFKVGNYGKASAYTLDADNKYNVKDAKLSYRNTAQYKDSLNFKPDVVVIMMGVNDIRSMSCDQARDALKEALSDLAWEYCALDSVQKVYIATSIMIPSSATIYQYSDGRLQDLQREVAAELGLDVIDIYSMTREYLNVKMHYTKDRIHPVAESYGEMARAFYSALTGETYTATVPDVSDSGVVYVKSGGKTTGKGESPENAVNSLAKAVGLLRNGGGTVVICGPYSFEYEMYLPHHEGNITVTSVYSATDYAKTASAKLGIAKNFYLYGDYTFEKLSIVSEAENTFITFNYNNVTFGDGIESSLKSGIKTYPMLLVGHNVALGDAFEEDLTLHGECNVTVNSGKWAYLRGGNRRANAAYPNFGSDKDAKLNITINGGEYMNPSGPNLTSCTGMGGFDGDMSFTINGGIFHGDIHAIGRSGTNSTNTAAEMSGTVNLTVNGGTFDASIKYSYDTSTKITGKVNLKISSALKSKAVGFENITVS